MKYKIYKHTSPSGKVYIGLTCLKNVVRRWRNGGKGYFSKDKFGNFQQTAMVRAINKYPWDSWKHEIIDECETKEEADNLEIKYIEKYNSTDSNFGYNITKGGSHSGHPVSQETKNKLSRIIKDKWKNDLDYRNRCIEGLKKLKMPEKTKLALIKANTGRIFSQETKDKISKANGIVVLLFSLDGKYINEFQSATKAAEAIGMTTNSVCNLCLEKTKKCGKYFFVYKKDFENDSEIINRRIKKLQNKKTRAIPIVQISLEDEFIKEWPSTTKASNELNISLKSINNCLKLRSKSAGNYKWKYKNEYIIEQKK